MAESKLPYSWGRIKPGDIISFRYKSKSGQSRVQTILVLNPKLPVTLKDGKKTFHLIGIKLKEAGKIKLRLTGNTVKRLEKVGDLKAVDEKNGLYRLEIFKRFVLNDIKGLKSNAYDILSQSLGVQGKYRTYIWSVAKKSSVSLEPIRIFTKQSRGLEEQEEERIQKELEYQEDVETEQIQKIVKKKEEKQTEKIEEKPKK